MFAKLLTSTSLQGMQSLPCLYEMKKYNLNKLLICRKKIQRTQLLPLPVSGHNLLTMMGLYYHSVAHTPADEMESSDGWNKISRREDEPAVLLTFERLEEARKLLMKN